MLDRALAAGVNASYVLMDSWFTFAPLIQAIRDRGMDVIGMVKAGNQRYLFEGKRLTLKELYHAATPVGTLNKSILRYVRAELVPGIPIMMIGHTTIVFSRYILLAWQHRLSTDQRTLGGGTQPTGGNHQ